MPVRYVPITITLRENAVLPDGPPAGNSARSTPALTGRALRGMVSRTLRRLGVADEVHDRIVLSGAVSFTAAHPLTSDDQVCLPLPLCLRVCRETGQMFDLSDPARQLVPGLSKPDGELVAVKPSGEFAHWVWVTRVGQGRIQRDRARGRPTERTGGPFHVSALAAGQEFRAWWRVAADTEDQLDDLLFDLLGMEEHRKDGVRIGLGRAKDTAHGGDALLTVGDMVDRAVDVRLPEFAPGKDVWVLLLAPALVVDPDTGEYHPDALGAAVTQRFAGLVRVRSVWTAPQLTGGYNATWRGFLPEEWAAAPGSVVRCEVTAPDGLTPEQIAEQILAVERQPLGDHWIDGYGAFLVFHPPPAWALQSHTIKPRPTEDQTDQPVDAALVDQILEVATDTLCWQRLDLTLRDAAVRSAEESRNVPSPSLLGRLRDTLHVTGDVRRVDQARQALSGLSTLLTGLADKAARDLDAALIALPGRSRIALRVWLTELATSPEALLFNPDGTDLLGLTRQVKARILTQSEVDDQAAEQWLREHAAPLGVRFLDEWFRQVARNAKENAA
ncbi:MAG: hypothetical protein ACRDTG_02665 [Pseudonocardiaceae bacterium]